MEHVTIISQEAITRGLLWPPLVVGIAGILFALAPILYLIIKPKNVYDRIIYLFYHAATCIVLMMLTCSICSYWFPVETGRYKYEGTLDPEMTIVEFEEFQQKYSNVRFEDDVWKWEDK